MAAVVAVLVSVVPACSDDLVVTATPPDTDGAVTAVLQQWREDEVRGVFMVTVWNRTDRAIDVADLAVAWAGFAEPAASRPEYSVGAGVKVDLAVPVVPARCAQPLRLDDSPPPPDGAAVTVNGALDVPVDDPAGVLARLYEQSCHDQYVAAATGIRLGTAWAPGDVGGTPVLQGTLELHPPDGTEIEVDGTDGSIMMSLEVTGPPTPLADGGTALPVDVGRLGRCDAHALGENKQAYRFEVSMTVDGSSVQATLMVPDDLRPAMYDVVKRRCGVA